MQIPVQEIKAASDENHIQLGANCRADEVWEFCVWAPTQEKIALHIIGPHDRIMPMEKIGGGYHYARVSDLPPGARYFYRLDNSSEYPDPASRFQPEGVHGPSEAVDLTAFPWTDSAWRAPALVQSIFYEVHTGTYSREGAFDGMARHLPELADLGITTIELMPVAQFPGRRNWGYDGVYPFAVQNSYGGPVELQRFVNEAHKQGLAVALDVVYNHLGPEGNYLGQFGPYFSDRYHTPWGEAINFDGPESDAVRRFFIENALYWFEHYHIDVLRLDAIHGIFDFSAYHVLAELQDEVVALSRRLNRTLTLIAESDLNDAKVVAEREKGGYGLPGQWSDDFHHALHTLLTGESNGYYADFGTLDHLVRVLRNGWYYDGKYSVFRRRRHGNSAQAIPRSRLVVAIQNHDQVGNRAQGDRLSTLVSFEAQKLAAGVTLLSPFVPLLFMGEEYGEKAPFQYFTSHGDRRLIEAVRRGRREEFTQFGWSEQVPDPQDETTFEDSKLHHEIEMDEPHRTLRSFHKELIRFRRCHFQSPAAEWDVAGEDANKMLTLTCRSDGGKVILSFNFSLETGDLPPLPAGDWIVEINSAEAKWLGPVQESPAIKRANDRLVIAPSSFVVLRRAEDSGT